MSLNPWICFPSYYFEKVEALTYFLEDSFMLYLFGISHVLACHALPYLTSVIFVV
jgi:hypothetical protein